MKFKFIKEVSSAVGVYGGNTVKTGDTIELEGFLAEKAKTNPDFKEVKPRGNKKSDKSESA